MRSILDKEIGLKVQLCVTRYKTSSNITKDHSRLSRSTNRKLSGKEKNNYTMRKLFLANHSITS